MGAVAFDLAEPDAHRGRRSPASAPSIGSRSRRWSATQNNVKEYDIAAALRLVTLKMVGYTEVVHALSTGSPRTRRS